MCPFKKISKLCRLCSLEVEYGFDIFVESEIKASLVILINKYLPIKVTEDEFLPKQICESCHIGVAATVDLIDRMVEGQHKLRKLYEKIKRDQESKECSEGKISSKVLSGIGTSLAAEMTNTETSTLEDLQEAKEQPVTKLINIQGNGSDIEMDDLAKGTEVKKVYHSHPLGLVMEGGKPKRRRGRPKKGSENMKTQKIPSNKDRGRIANVGNDRPKRRKALPCRLKDSVGEKDLEKVLLKGSVEGDYLHQDNSETQDGNDGVEIQEEPLRNTHTLYDGSIVTVTPNHRMGDSFPVPDAVNIELDFIDASCISEAKDGSEVLRVVHTPKASISTVHEEERVIRDQVPGREKRRRVSSRKKFKHFCEYCDKGFFHAGRYTRHLKLHRNMILQCDECKDRYSNKEDITLHQESTNHKGIGLLEVNNEKNLSIKCPSCIDRVFATQECYKSHVTNMHEGQKPFVCLVCGKRFAYKHSLKTHHLMHEPEKDKKVFPCKVCDREFHYQSSLVYHVETRHNPERKFVCVFCGCSFNHKQLLKRHHLVHSENRPYSCKICGSSFKTKGNLYNHMNIHNKSKIYTCEICSKKFSHLTSLNLHIRSHTGEKPFTCPHCGKKFSQNGNLQEHIRIHTGVKPYCCSLCGKRFTTSSQMSFHEKRHKGENKFRCSVCSKGFFSRDIFLMHELKHKTSNGSVSSSKKQHLPAKFIKLQPQPKNSKSEKNNKVFKDSFDFPNPKQAAENPQMEKSWLIAEPAVLEAPTLNQPSDSHDILYVIPKKEDANFELIPFNTDEILEDPLTETLPAVSLMGGNAISTNFVLPHSNADRNFQGNTKITYQNPSQITVSESGFEITLKEPNPTTTFNISNCEDSPLYIRKVFNE